METTAQTRFQQILQQRLVEIAEAGAATVAARATVTLDQQSVGRLSRMDTLQQQATANATHSRRGQEALRITAAFKRIEQDEFGACLDCGGEIDLKRLEFDAAIVRCITCVRG